MKTTRLLPFGFLFIVLILLSCKKESTSSPSTKTTKEILMAAQWKKSAYRENGVTVPFYAACEMDDVLSFMGDGNYIIDQGTIQCSSYCNCNDFYVIDADNKTMRWGLYGAGEISFNDTKTSFTFTRTGANTFEYIFVRK